MLTHRNVNLRQPSCTRIDLSVTRERRSLVPADRSLRVLSHVGGPLHKVCTTDTFKQNECASIKYYYNRNTGQPSCVTQIKNLTN